MNKRIFVAVIEVSDNGKDFRNNGSLPEVFSTMANAKKFARKWADKYGTEIKEEGDCTSFAYRIIWRTEADIWMRVTIYGRNLNAVY